MAFKVCVFGEQGSYHTETIIDLFKKVYDVMWFVDNIGTAMELAATNTDITMSYNPIDIERYNVFIVCNEAVFNTYTQKVDITNIITSVDLIKRYGRNDSTVIIESTVGVGTTRKLFGITDMNVAYSPSRFDNTNASIMPSDIPKLIGGIDNNSERVVFDLYTRVFNVIVPTGTCEIAEGATLLERANTIVQKAFINEFAHYCKRMKLDVHRIIDASMNKNMTTSPCVGKAENDLSARQLIFHDEDWPVLYSAHNQLERQPNKTYERIVEIYCGKQNYDELHKKCFLFVGIGEQIGSMTTKNSPVLAIINYLEMEGAVVKKYDMFIEEYSDIPHMEHNSGLPRFDGIIIIHPYLISKWEQYSYATFFCRH
jgi:UDP-N-acetyl-D-mannosaminuronate dehydrogenase